MNERHKRAGLSPKPQPSYHQTRNPVTPSGRGFRAKFFSPKNRRLVRCESLLEFDALFLMEFARGIRLFEEQPITVEYRLGGRKRTYTPDFSAEWADGRRWFVEVKPSDRLAEPPNAEKFDALTQWFASRGEFFLVLTELQIRPPVRLRQIRDLLRKRVTSNSNEVAPHLPIVGPGTSIADMRAGGVDRKLIWQFLADRSLVCDLDSVIDDQTIVLPYEEADDVALFI
ncbi:TnsA endonuclease N-terminal domain-containing protein [Paraburkholderia phenoliruptrix]|uniref:TnsA endonuclease N-terminal domain-containing protein n=1 Tax=Paraburkholderia phenoliruptrix TaxID=252970 RepID=A0ABV3W963_9BURK